MPGPMHSLATAPQCTRTVHAIQVYCPGHQVTFPYRRSGLTDPNVTVPSPRPGLPEAPGGAKKCIVGPEKWVLEAGSVTIHFTIHFPTSP